MAEPETAIKFVGTAKSDYYQMNVTMAFPAPSAPTLQDYSKRILRPALYINTRNVKRERIPDLENHRTLVREYDVTSDAIVEWYENADRA